MRVKVLKNAEELGKEAALLASGILKKAISTRGKARLVLSTGASQFETLKALVKMDVPWEKVEMFHLDEYVGLPESHPASFRGYLKQRFTNLVNLKQAHFVNGEGDIAANIRDLSLELRKEPIDLGIVGVGENSHIAFNDPPANFDTKEAYIVVKLDERCKQQQVGEGWFANCDEVPKEAITMTVYQIMQCKAIIAPVPHLVKADAIKRMLESDVTNLVPATKLKEHPNCTLLIDENSASQVAKSVLMEFGA